ncbi:NAD(P)/FAD-dependent oxidoreductase [Actinomadura harenae]|uniref:Squalene monooxygenase n=1 Tax=Actinomadura harenae TaxID=2483351 RepID=A0A3M2M3E3_9ACTN|nr:hypothetical protein [Actinomadura harenae]RMI43932.1 hypothetical protein EBO15_14625 [Actinomadura harenae]
MAAVSALRFEACRLWALVVIGRRWVGQGSRLREQLLIRRPERRESVGRVHGTAIVIGAGMSGLLAARVLAECFTRVLVLERDVLPNGPEFRPGVPQARHIHAMLARGTHIYEGLYPGLCDELQGAGASLIDCGQSRVLFPHGWAASQPSGIPLLLVSRLLLETRVRQRTAALDNVEICDATRVTGLCFSPGGNTVIGVRASRRRADHRGRDALSSIRAELVVDASGRSSKLAEWLCGSGCPRPKESVLDAHMGYASRIYQVPEHRLSDPVMLAELLHAPDLPRGHASARIEGNRLMVTLQGVAECQPPRDEQGFTQFTRSLRGPLQEILQDLQPATPIYRFARMASRKVAYHRLADWPGGLTVLGDALCSFNPVYGQGMTVAGLEALVLRDHFARSGELTPAACRRLQRRLARSVTWPWLISTLADRGWLKDHRPGIAERCARRFMELWFRAIPGDPAMFRRFQRVAHLLDGPVSVMAPAVLVRILIRMACPHPADEEVGVNGRRTRPSNSAPENHP